MSATEPGMTPPEETQAAAPDPPVPPEPPVAPGSTNGAPGTPSAKIARRRALLLVAMLLGLVAIVAFGILGYQSFTARLASAEKLDRATALVEDADAIVVRIDAVVRAEVTPELANEASKTAGEISEAEALLDEAVELVDEAAANLNDDERERAALLRDSAETRQLMLEQAPAILSANMAASSAMPPAAEGWEAVLKADQLADKAVASYNKLTRRGVRQSQKLNIEAGTVLGKALKRFKKAEDAFKEAPFGRYIDYVEQRIKLNRLSRQSDTAWLKGDLKKANSLITTYNKEDRKAVAMAKKLPATPEAAIADVFETSVSEATEAYYSARVLALEADQRLRSF